MSCCTVDNRYLYAPCDIFVAKYPVSIINYDVLYKNYIQFYGLFIICIHVCTCTHRLDDYRYLVLISPIHVCMYRFDSDFMRFGRLPVHNLMNQSFSSNPNSTIGTTTDNTRAPHSPLAVISPVCNQRGSNEVSFSPQT